MLFLSSIASKVRRVNQVRPGMLRKFSFTSFCRSTASSGNLDGIFAVKSISGEVLG